MKNTRPGRYLFLVLFVSIITLFSCKKKEGDSAGPITPANPTALVTAVGTPIGIVASVTIGVAGGVLQSGDGRLIVTIPAGALTSNTQVSIQPITNEAPLGFGLGYRLEPEGTTFSVPVTLVFNYTDSMVSQVPEDFLWIVTQAINHSWNAIQHIAHDRNANTLTVQTTHFSDYGVGKFIEMHLNPVTPFVPTNQSLQLSISGFLRDADITDDDELAPLIPKIANLNEDLTPLSPLLMGGERLMSFHPVQWTLNGTAAPVTNQFGSLVESGGAATYTTPAEIPSVNPVAVTVELWVKDIANQYHTYYLTSNITVVEYDMYITLTFDHQNTFTYYQFELNPDPNDLTQVICSFTDGKLGILGKRIVNSTVSSNIWFEMNNPEEVTRPMVGTNELGNDEITFFPSGQSVLYELNWDKRFPTGATSCDVIHDGGDISLSLTQFTGQGSIAVGHFSGVLYEDPPGYSDNCEMPIAHSVECDFRLMVY